MLKQSNEIDQPPVLVWDREPVSVDASSAMDRAGSQDDASAVSATKTALVEVLAAGRVTVTECKRQIRESGASTNDRTLARVRKELGIRASRDGGIGGVWYWELPPNTHPDETRSDSRHYEFRKDYEVYEFRPGRNS